MVNFWQVAAGEGSRDYSSVFSRFGLMLIGGGEPGPFFEQRDYYEKHHDWRSQVVSFAEKVQQGDAVILKKPHRKEWEIIAVGQVTGPYEYLELFDDVEGWDLRHCRKVEWVKPSSKTLVSSLARGTFRAVNSLDVQNKASEILQNSSPSPTNPLPPPVRRISDEELVERLIDNGLRPADAETVIQTIGRVRRLAKWYSIRGRDISEHETRTFLIMPVLLALGWSEQKLKIEWNNLDVAFFDGVYGKADTHCIMILESKRMWEGLSYAEWQIKRYSEKFPLCSRLVISDGVCYRLYRKENDDWKWVAYMNLLKLKDSHPYYTDIKGAGEIFVKLMP